MVVTKEFMEWELFNLNLFSWNVTVHIDWTQDEAVRHTTLQSTIITGAEDISQVLDCSGTKEKLSVESIISLYQTRPLNTGTFPVLKKCLGGIYRL